MNLERELQYLPPGATEPVPVRIRFELPKPSDICGWACDITIEGFPDEPPYLTQMFGSEPLDAMISALSAAPVLLHGYEGKLTYCGSEDLGFPHMFPDPNQDWQFMPSNGGEPRRVWIRILLPERTDDGWSVLVKRIEHKTWQRKEWRIQAPTWPQALERAAAAVPAFLQEYVAERGGGALEEVNDPPACAVPNT